MPFDAQRHAETPAGWQELAHRLGGFYHDARWIAGLARCLQLEVQWLTLEQGSSVVGGLPLMAVPALFGRRRLVSLPFGYAAGPLGDSLEQRHALATAARDLAAERKVRRLEIKQVGTGDPPAPGFQRLVHYHTYRVATDDGEAAVWQRLHADSTRRGVKKAEKEGVEVVTGRSASEWSHMSELEEATARRHGLPAPPPRFFTEFCLELQNQQLAELLLARLRDGRIAAGIVLWKARREWIYAFGASDPRTLEHRPNHALLWAALKQAVVAGVDLDLGRAAPEQTTLVEFKRRWGGQPVPLAYDYWPNVGGLQAAPRDRGVLAAVPRLWSLLPAAAARWGSRFYRYLG